MLKKPNGQYIQRSSKVNFLDLKFIKDRVKEKLKVFGVNNSIDKPVYCGNCGLPLYNCTCNIDSE